MVTVYFWQEITASEKLVVKKKSYLDTQGIAVKIWLIPKVLNTQSDVYLIPSYEGVRHYEVGFSKDGLFLVLGRNIIGSRISLAPAHRKWQSLYLHACDQNFTAVLTRHTVDRTQHMLLLSYTSLCMIQVAEPLTASL